MGKCTIKFDRQREIKTGKTKKQLKRESLIDSTCSNKHTNGKRKQAQPELACGKKLAI